MPTAAAAAADGVVVARGAEAGGCAGAAAARAALAGAHRAAEALRHELAGGARPTRRGEADAGGARPISTASSRAIADNLARLDAEALTMAQAIAVAPFAPKLVQLVEARIRVEDMNAAARGRDDHRRHQGDRAADGGAAAGESRSRRRSARPPSSSCAPSPPSGSTSTTATTRSSPGGWACRTPRWTRRSRTTRRCCATRSPPRTCRCPPTPATSEPIAAAAQLKFADVPDLNEIIALPQDEMRDIVARFTGAGGGGGGGRGARRRAGSRRGVLHELAGGAEVARLRQAVAQRAGRLPVHPPHRGDADRAREPEARSQSAAQARRDAAFPARRAAAKA